MNLNNLKDSVLASASQSYGDINRWLTADNEQSTTYIAEYNNSSAITQKNMEEEFNTLQKLRKAWVENSNAINVTVQAQKDLATQLRDLRGITADDSISSLKASITMEKDLTLKTLDAQYTALEKVINAKIKSLELDKSAADYAKSLEKSQEEAQVIQNKINVLSLDNSIEAKAQMAILVQQLAEKQEVIAQTQSNHSIEMQKKALNDQLTDAKTASDLAKKDQTYAFDTRLNDEANFAKLRLDIVNGNITNVEKAIKASIDNINKYTKDELEKLGVTSTSVATVVDNATKAGKGSATTTKTNVYGNATDIERAKSAPNADKYNFITTNGDASQAEAGSYVLGGTGAIKNVGAGERIAGNDANDTFNLFTKLAGTLDTGGSKKNVYGNLADIEKARTSANADKYNFITTNGDASMAEQGSYVLGGTSAIKGSGKGTRIAGIDANETFNLFDKMTKDVNTALKTVNVYGSARDIELAKTISGADKFNFITVANGNASMAQNGDFVLGGTNSISSSGQGERIAGNTEHDTLALFTRIANSLDTLVRINVYGNETDIVNAKKSPNADKFNFVVVSNGDASMAEKGSYVLGGNSVISNAGQGTRIQGKTAEDTSSQFNGVGTTTPTPTPVVKRDVYGRQTDIDLAKTVSNADKFNFITVNDGNASMAKSGSFALGGNAVISDAGLAERIIGNDAEETLALFKKRTASMDTGGLTPSWGAGGKLAILHQDELVSSKFDTSLILKAMNISQSILNNFKLPNLAMPNFKHAMPGANITIAPSISFSGSGALKKSDLDGICDYVNGKIFDGLKGFGFKG